ncbi:MAG: sulfite exporter TauE/SafE family protein [Planctomycetota bacterium]
MTPLLLLLLAANAVAAAPSWAPIAAVAAGAIVGLSLGLTGGGGAIFAVPLLVYWIGMAPQTAVAISLVTVAATAAVGAIERWRYGQVEIPTGLLFAAAGMLTAPLGSWLGSRIPEQPLLLAFAVLMLVIAVRMWQKARVVEERLPPSAVAAGSGPACRRDPEGKLRLTSRCATVLALVGLAVGFLSGLFGVGGGFLIVPALVTFAAMGVPRAVGTSLFVMTLVGSAAVATQVAAGREIPLDIAGGFVAGSIPGLFAGSAIGRRLTGPLLARMFAVAIVAVAVFVIARELLAT